MAKKKIVPKKIGWERGDICPDCGNIVNYLKLTLPPHTNYIWFVYHKYTQRVCEHIEEDIPLSLKIDY